MSTTTESESEYADSEVFDDPRALLLHSHQHGLVLLEFTQNFSIDKCSVCSSSVKGGPAYHCPNCSNFFLHKYCAELPYAIQHHPFHPQHRLELIEQERYSIEIYSSTCSGCSIEIYPKEYCYECSECGIALHVGCVAATIITRSKEQEHNDKPEEEAIQHISHQHPLESFCLDSPLSPYCWACKEKNSGPAYGCRACVFMLHESCSQSPQEINNHPFHPKHPLTLAVNLEHELTSMPNNSNWLVYRCNECDFDLDLRCAIYVDRHHISNPQDQDDHNNEDDPNDGLEINHFFHPYPLTSCYNKGGGSGLDCDFCDEMITGDLYVCGDCSFKLHKSCAELPQEMVHPLHPSHPLLLQTYSMDCAICWSNHKILFKCQECDFGLHPKCAIQSLSTSEEELVVKMQHIHKHPLRLQMSPAGHDRCIFCREDAGGLVYACDKGQCYEVNIHRSCAEATQGSKHSIHPQHPLIYLSQPPDKSSACSACLNLCSEFTFYCDRCKFQFHPCCVMMKPILKHERHEHSLTSFRKSKGKNVQCNVCYDDCSASFYRCVPCNYYIHKGCLPLPPSVKHEWHIHSMDLCSKYINDTFDDQFCDICETLRHPECGVYVCKECRCAVHIDCVIPNPRVDLEKRRRMEDLKIDKLGGQIGDLEMEINKIRIHLESLEKHLEQLKAEKVELVVVRDERWKDKM